ncbi:hypothetical protein A5886_000698 [Enterococcus sp. 8G7_MSG3316]|uniref:HTH rpiR-type domain-containing protein n=1 Tax=Candidatus Enterococcus testudinis TaxID=1834191 RepID=A0A242A4T9_9ENTE|nr:MurR/RpiR family transcriptional regulator [Enterococcus sp. 8G7_MSG3316]OTN75623.1 hypothetical protein A5886_000698 [Enterococcus sp. 8G7_MSG3316]
MGLLIIRLLNLLNNAPANSTNYFIGLTMINHYEAIKKMSIGEFAELCHVSKSTVSKFARTLGFDDYSDLKDNAAFIENRFNNPLNYRSNILFAMEQDGIDPYFDAVIKDMQYLKEHLDMPAITRFAQAIYDHKKVFAFGILFSESAAIDFQFKLAYNGKFIRTFQDDIVQEELIKSADEQDLFIIFTNSGDYLTKQQIRNGTPRKDFFTRTKAKVMVITSNPEISDFSFVKEAIIFPHQTSYQTHAYMYQMITDLIVSRFKTINEKK